MAKDGMFNTGALSSAQKRAAGQSDLSPQQEVSQYLASKLATVERRCRAGGGDQQPARGLRATTMLDRLVKAINSDQNRKWPYGLKAQILSNNVQAMARVRSGHCERQAAATLGIIRRKSPVSEEAIRVATKPTRGNHFL